MTRKSKLIERGNRLRNLRKKVGLTRLEFAEKTGISASTLKAIELGDRELTPQKALLFSNLFSGLFAVSLGEDFHEAQFDCLYYGKIKETQALDNVLDDTDERLQTDINFFARSSDYIILEISDNLMSPFYNKSDIVAGRKVNNQSTFSLYQGHICIIESLKGDKCLRRIIKSNGRKITSYILNNNEKLTANFVEEIEAASIAQAIWHWHLSELLQTPTRN